MGFIDTLTTKGPIEDSRIDYFPDAVPRDCVLYLPLSRNRLRGDTFRSLDSYRHPCTVTGAVWTPQGRTFDGVDDYITVPDHAALSGLAALTIMVWAYSTVHVEHEALVGKYYHNTDREWIFKRGTGAEPGLELALYDQSANAYIRVTRAGGSNLNDVRWHLLTASWDGTDITGIATYVDGNSVSHVDDSSGGFVAIEDGARPVVIGRQENLTARDYNGQMGQALVFSRALTPQEIQRLYLATKDRYQ